MAVNRKKYISKVKLNILFQTKTFVGLDRDEWIFLAISVINILLAMIFTIVAMSVYIEPSSPDFTFAIIVIINAGKCLKICRHLIVQS